MQHQRFALDHRLLLRGKRIARQPRHHALFAKKRRDTVQNIGLLLAQERVRRLHHPFNFMADLIAHAILAHLKLSHIFFDAGNIDLQRVMRHRQPVIAKIQIFTRALCVIQ